MTFSMTETTSSVLMNLKGLPKPTVARCSDETAHLPLLRVTRRLLTSKLVWTMELQVLDLQRALVKESC